MHAIQRVLDSVAQFSVLDVRFGRQAGDDIQTKLVVGDKRGRNGKQPTQAELARVALDVAAAIPGFNRLLQRQLAERVGDLFALQPENMCTGCIDAQAGERGDIGFHEGRGDAARKHWPVQEHRDAAHFCIAEVVAIGIPLH